MSAQPPRDANSQRPNGTHPAQPPFGLSDGARTNGSRRRAASGITSAPSPQQPATRRSAFHPRAPAAALNCSPCCRLDSMNAVLLALVACHDTHGALKQHEGRQRMPNSIRSFFPAARARACGRCRAPCIPSSSFASPRPGSSFLAATCSARRPSRASPADRRLQQRPSLPGQGGGRAGRRRAARDRAGAGGAQHGAGHRRCRACSSSATTPTASWSSCRPTTSSGRDAASGGRAPGAEVAATGKLVLFGIRPTAPHTGYGYIRRGARWPVSRAHLPSKPSRRSRTRDGAKTTLRPALLLEQRHLRAGCRALPRRAGAPRARLPRSSQGGAGGRQKIWASCGSTPRPLPRRPTSPSTMP